MSHGDVNLFWKNPSFRDCVPEGAGDSVLPSDVRGLEEGRGPGPLGNDIGRGQAGLDVTASRVEKLGVLLGSAELNLDAFGIINIIGNFGTVFVDQSYWQTAIAAKPGAAHKGYILGGMVWFAIPFALGTSLGLAGGCGAGVEADPGRQRRASNRRPTPHDRRAPRSAACSWAGASHVIWDCELCSVVTRRRNLDFLSLVGRFARSECTSASVSSNVKGLVDLDLDM